MQICSQCPNPKFDTIIKNGKEHDLCLICIDRLSSIEDRVSQNRIATLNLIHESLDAISEDMELIGGVPRETLPRIKKPKASATNNTQNFHINNSNFGNFSTGSIQNSTLNGSVKNSYSQQNQELESILTNLKTAITSSTENQENSKKKALAAVDSLAEEGRKPGTERSLPSIKTFVSQLITVSEGLSQIEKIILLACKIAALFGLIKT